MKNDPKRMRGAELRALRESMNMTQEQVADLIGAEVTTISRWERDVAPIRASAALALRIAHDNGYKGKGPRKRGGPRKTKAQKRQEKLEWAKSAPSLIQQ